MTIAINANPGQSISLVLNLNDGSSSTVISNIIIQETFTVGTNGQVNFILSQVPTQSTSIIMIVNGIKQTQVVDYTISGKLITFLNTDFTLKTTDIIDFYYISNSSSAGYYEITQESQVVDVNGKTNFSLLQIPITSNSVIMFLNGVMQTQNVDYTITNNSIIFLNSGLTLNIGDTVDFYYAIVSPIITFDGFFQEKATVIDNQTNFILSQEPTSSDSVIMFVNGVKQVKDFDYTVLNNSITFLNTNFSLISSDVVEFYYGMLSNTPVIPDGYIPTIDQVYLPNFSLASGFPQNMTLLTAGIYKYTLTLPTSTIGTFIVVASYESNIAHVVKKEVFLINVSNSASGGGFVAPG